MNANITPDNGDKRNVRVFGVKYDHRKLAEI